MLDLTRMDLLDWLDGVGYLETTPSQFAQIESFCRRVEMASPFPVQLAFFYDAKLVS